MPEKAHPAGQDARAEALTDRSDDQTVRSPDAPDRRVAGERRVQALGRPAGERRKLRRRASDAKKPPCPFCGSCTSSVYRSKGLITSDKYRRRRQCADCREDFPTKEELDVEQFVDDLKRKGLTLEDLGLAPATAAAENPAEGQRRAADGRRPK